MNNKEGLQASLDMQALTLKDKGDLDGAMVLLKQQEQICRDIGNTRGLASSLYNQAVVLNKKGLLMEALARVEDASRLAKACGLLALERQSKPLLEFLRSKR